MFAAFERIASMRIEGTTYRVFHQSLFPVVYTFMNEDLNLIKGKLHFKNQNPFLFIMSTAFSIIYYTWGINKPT